MTDSFVEKISDWAIGIGILVGIVAWWFARTDASRKSDALERYKADSAKEVAKANNEAAQAKLALGLVSLENGPRSRKLYQSQFKELIASILPGEAEVLYKPEDEEACSSALGRSIAHSSIVISSGSPFIEINERVM